MIEDYFKETLAKAPGSAVTVPNASAQVFARSDTGFTTPLELAEYPSGVSLGTTLVASPDGIYPHFTVVSGERQVIARSGDVLTPMESIMGTTLEVVPDPRTAEDGDVPMVRDGVYEAVSLPTAEEMQQAREDTSAAAQAAQTAAGEAQESAGHVDQAIRDGVPPAVAQVIATDPTVVDAAANRALNTAGVVTGASTVSGQEGTAWAQTTEPDSSGRVWRLPLGYAPDGHLDPFARRIWREDLDGAHYIQDSEWALLWLTAEGHILLGVRWSGEAVIPGLRIPESTATPLVLDVPHEPGSFSASLKPNLLSFAGWGSSTIFGVAGDLEAMLARHGCSYYDGGKGSERIEHSAARQGALPAHLLFENGQIPASGSVPVGVFEFEPFSAAVKVYSGTVTTRSGNRVAGALRPVDGQYVFERTTPGSLELVEPGAEFVPIDGVAHRADVMLLQAGKNNLTLGNPNPLNDPENVVEKTLQMVKYQAAFAKRVLVIGQFANTGWTASHQARSRIRAADDMLAQELGHGFLDIYHWVSSPAVWDGTGIEPTQEDLDQQALGNKPPSLSRDNGHFNDAGNAAYTDRIEQHLVGALEWIS